MRFLKHILLPESVIDIPRRIYAPGVYDNADTDNPKLKQEVLDMIDKQIKEFKKLGPIVQYYLIGSILTKRYRNDADLDINVLFDVPGTPEEQEAKREELGALLKDINGKEVPGTEHPINYFIQTNPDVAREALEKADGVFDIVNNNFLRRPEPDTFDPKKYEADFQKKVQEIDIIKGELQRDIIDYKVLKELTPNDVLDLQSIVNDKIEEIEESIRLLKQIGDDIVNDRRDIFSRDLTPDEIREFGKSNKLPKNVIYKMLEKYHYMKFYKKLKEILEDDKITDDEIDSLSVNEGVGRGTAVFTFGRFNPPTIGHGKLLKKVSATPGDYKFVYLSKSQDSKKNPLTPTQKLQYMRSMFPQNRGMFRVPKSNMILEIATELHDKGYDNIKMIVGSDRVREFDTILKKYNDVKSRHGYYKFNNITVISAGERDPDAEGATGMSASKMRDAVAQGDYKSFLKGIPRAFRDVKQLFRDIAVGMRITTWKQALAASVGHHLGYENKPIASMEEFDKKTKRDLYIREVIFNIGDTVKYMHERLPEEDKIGIIRRRGTNYLVIEDNNNNLHKCWIYDCVPVSSDKEVVVREYNLNQDYGFKAVEAYEIGADYANHCKDMTPGETPDEKPKAVGSQKDGIKVEDEDVKSDKYNERIKSFKEYSK